MGAASSAPRTALPPLPDEIMTFLNSLKVRDLKQQLKERGYEVTGLKSELRERLIEAYCKDMHPVKTVRRPASGSDQKDVAEANNNEHEPMDVDPLPLEAEKMNLAAMGMDSAQQKTTEGSSIRKRVRSPLKSVQAAMENLSTSPSPLLKQVKLSRNEPASAASKSLEMTCHSPKGSPFKAKSHHASDAERLKKAIGASELNRMAPKQIKGSLQIPVEWFSTKSPQSSQLKAGDAKVGAPQADSSDTENKTLVRVEAATAKNAMADIRAKVRTGVYLLLLLCT